MDPDPLPIFWLSSLLIIFLLLLLSAFFSGMEIAFISANKLKVELSKKQGRLSGRILSTLFQNPKSFIATMLVGNNIALVAYTRSAEIFYKGIFANQQINSSWMEYFNPSTSPWIALITLTIITTILVLFVAEFIPKAIFRLNPNRWLEGFSIPLRIINFLFTPFSAFVVWLSGLFLKTIFKNGKSEDEHIVFGKTDLDHFLKEASDNVDSEDELENEIQILQNALDFSDLKARDCLVPRNEVIALNIDDDLEVLNKLFIKTGLSKVLIYRESIDNIIGYVHSYEMFKKPDSIKSILLPVSIVPEPMPVMQVLENLIKSKKNMAVVLDEFGGTSGILTMEDIVEEIFGEIIDEHDKEELIEKEIDERTFLFSARIEIDYLNDKFKLDLPEEENYETLSGFIIHHYADIPHQGAVIQIEDFEFTILKVHDTRIDQVKLVVNTFDI